MGTLLGGPHNKDYSICGSILGSPHFGNLPFDLYNCIVCFCFSEKVIISHLALEENVFNSLGFEVWTVPFTFC